MDSRDEQILELHSQGMSQRQIAEALGISQPAVKKRLARLVLKGDNQSDNLDDNQGGGVMEQEEINTVKEAESALEGLKKAFVEAEMNGEDVGHQKPLILELEGKLGSLRQRESEGKEVEQRRKGAVAARSYAQGGLALWVGLIGRTKAFNEGLESLAEKARVEEQELTARIDELVSKMPHDEPDITGVLEEKLAPVGEGQGTYH